MGAGGEGVTHAGVSKKNPMVIDLEASLFGAHRRLGTGEPWAALLQSGNARSNTVAEHIQAVKDSEATT